MLLKMTDGFPVRVPQYGAEVVLPTLAAPITLTSGAANTFGAWTTIGTLPSGEEAIMSEALMAVFPFTSTKRGIVELRHSGTTTFDVFPATLNLQDPTADAVGSAFIPYSLAPYKVPAGALIEGRYRCTAATQDIVIYLTYWPQKNFPQGAAIQRAWEILSGQEVGPTVWTPALTSVGTGATAGAGYTFGAWTQLIASATAGLLTGLEIDFVVQLITGRSVQVEIGIGGAGGEVAVYRTAILYGRSKSIGIDPPVLLNQGDRVAVRQANSAGAVSQLWHACTHNFV